MRVKILELARDDLIEGFYFYEKQESGLGGYFLSSLYADIEALKIFFGIHPKAYRNFYRALSNRFPFAITTRTTRETFWFALWSTVAVGHLGFGGTSKMPRTNRTSQPRCARRLPSSDGHFSQSGFCFFQPDRV